jgi:hypothetical protein
MVNARKEERMARRGDHDDGDSSIPWLCTRA